MPLPILAWVAIAAGSAAVTALAASSSSKKSKTKESDSSDYFEQQSFKSQVSTTPEERRKKVLKSLELLLDIYTLKTQLPSYISNRQIDSFIKADIKNFKQAKLALDDLYGCTLSLKQPSHSLKKLDEQAAGLKHIQQLLQEV